ncbi:MAG TPA: hypothetical protein VJ302_13715 [Blastocatellia bacterium]|nr:hypothetical protein [Blastocatellia bacterium]
MENFSDKEFSADYFALKAANDLLRERGKQWLWDLCDLLASEINQGLIERERQPALQVARQDWQFKVENATMIGERMGLRYRTRTLIIEVGWPRLPEHGFVPDGGLARTRIGLSQNIMLEARTIAEFILRREGDGEPEWYLISNKRLGERVAESHLREYLNLVMSER